MRAFIQPEQGRTWVAVREDGLCAPLPQISSGPYDDAMAGLRDAVASMPGQWRIEDVPAVQLDGLPYENVARWSNGAVTISTDAIRLQELLAQQAHDLLTATDHVEYRIATPERTPSPAWLAWREQLREVVRGNLDAIPTEPARYTSTPSPPPEPTPDAIVFEEPAPDPELETLRARITELEALVVELTPPPPSEITEPPPEVLAEAQPDETLAELKARLLFEFASLRNMLIGHIPMTEPQLLRLQALEHPKFQTWLQA